MTCPAQYYLGESGGGPAAAAARRVTQPGFSRTKRQPRRETPAAPHLSRGLSHKPEPAANRNHPISVSYYGTTALGRVRSCRDLHLTENERRLRPRASRRPEREET